MNLLAVNGLSFAYRNGTRNKEEGKEWGLKDICFSANEGEHIALVGPNGSGKSTLFRLLSASLKPDCGCILFGGQDIHAYSPLERARRLALIPQGMRYEFPYTALEMVLMGLYPHLSRFEAADDIKLNRAKELMHETGIWHLAARPVTELSGGQLQSVILARSLLQILPETDSPVRLPPALLLMDEAMSELDISARITMMKLLSHYAASRKITVIGIQHDLHTAYRFASRVIALADGHIAADGPPETVFTQKFFAEIFAVNAEIITGKGFFLNA